ncbi:MAG: complement resistance protein TraT [Pseudomonadota bacterium]
MKNSTIVIFICILLFGCASKQRFGMVEDPETGLLYGSIVERNIFIDSSQLENKRIKVSIRNTSGDKAFDLNSFLGVLENAYAAKGYMPTKSDDFGIRLDVNVLYSGQIRTDMKNEFSFLGASAGGIAGYRSDTKAGTAIGILSGVALGAIIGSYVTDDTYIVISEINIGLIKPESGESKTTIIFSSSNRDERREQTGFKHFHKRLSTRVAAYAGGRSVKQSQIADGVRQRLSLILSDII